MVQVREDTVQRCGDCCLYSPVLVVGNLKGGGIVVQLDSKAGNIIVTCAFLAISVNIKVSRLSNISYISFDCIKNVFI